LLKSHATGIENDEIGWQDPTFLSKVSVDVYRLNEFQIDWAANSPNYRRRIFVTNQRFLKTLTKNHRSPSIAICGEFKSGQDIFHPRPSDHLDIAGGLSSEIIYIYYVRN